MNIKIGDIYEDCSYHPVRCNFIDDDGDYIEGVSLVDGSMPRSCGIRNCGVKIITEEEAKKLVELWKTKGEKAVMISKGWNEKESQDFIDKWRK